MESVPVESDPVASMSETGLCDPQPVSDGAGTDKRKEHVILLESDVLSMEHGLEKRSGSTGDITTHTDDSSYYITWTVYIALAVPRNEEPDVAETPEKAKKRNEGSSSVLMKTHTAQSCYHIEYELLPGDTETVKVDLVMFGPVAKMYKEDEVKILRTWHEGEQIWVGLTQKVNVKVNRDMLIGLLSHKIKLQVWNSKDKLSSQARYDRLKALRLPHDPPEDSTDMCGGTKSILNKVRSLWQKKSNMSKKIKRDPLFSSSLVELDSETGFHKIPLDGSNFEDLIKNGTASAEMNPVHLLAGETSLTERFPVCTAGVFELMCNISLDRPLISDKLKAELNPLVINILSATSLPSSPVPFHVLQERCVPVYCQYKFHNLTTHRTNHHKHSTNIYFRDVNVILTGLMSPTEFKEFLSGPPLEVEVHDRDSKFEELPKPRALFGTGTDHDIQWDMAQSKQRTSVFNSYGIASLNLSELLLGKKSLKVQVPIKCCPQPLTLHTERTAQDRNVSHTAASRHPMPQGHYFDANSTLKVKVELAYALNAERDSCEEGTDERPFGRIVYLFDYNNFSVMSKLKSEILRINASAFNLGSRSLENIERALSNYIMNFKLDESQDLDFVTGFHVVDKRRHIFVLEGLKHKAVQRLWESVPMKQSGSAEEQVIVLYNSNMSFFKRLYDSLDMTLSPVYLDEPLETIMRQPLIYIRGTVPTPCFQALTRLSQLCQIRQLKYVVQSNLFPTADMILRMNKEYGMDEMQWKQQADAKTEVDILTLPVRTKRHAPLDMHNRDYMKRKHSSQQLPRRHFKDFIQDNIKKVQEESERLQRPEAAVLRMDQSSDRPVYNYSTQTLNSKEQTMELIRREMVQVPGRRFTYSQQYHSATVEPGPVLSKADSSSTHTTTVWISSMGGNRCKGHPKHPDEARVVELRKPWRENILHANLLKPTLTRDLWAWSQRHEDFQLHSKPHPVFSPSPLSIHLAGDPLRQEQLEAARVQYSRWLEKLLPDSSTKPPGKSPCSQFKCHIGNSQRLQDILKDEPQKYSLRRPGMILKPLPQLSVMNFGADKAEEERSVALAPGPCVDCSLSSKHNAIPRHPSQYSKYHHIGFRKQHSLLYKRTAPPLTDHEKNIFYFQKDDMKACFTEAQPAGDTVEATILYTK
ncbi:uncharacterized protein cfap92 isoform X2 [Notolabrus celidotus]|uniref:uncharacterized protein cfap92 isoform X2 n=1 Tax=Notolabrus celidotus TaxID=1203425 RepID=UPI00149039A1|nr:uncharacterized protein cfap92 isoform X2 [Notolabrus celidotus]